MYLFFLVNFLLVVVVSFRAASPKMLLYKAIYNYSEQPFTLYHFDNDPFGNNLTIYFYRKENLKIISIKSLDEIPNSSSRNLVFFDNGTEPDIIPNHLSIVYTTYPEWIKSINVNNWVERAGGWKLYEVKD